MHCPDCLAALSETTKRHYQRRKAAGLCRYCDKPPADGKTMCAYHLELYRNYRFRIKLEALDAYGGPRCSACGYDREVSVLEIDHVDGGGRAHRREISMGGGGHPFYLWLKRNGYPDGFCVLCPTCNKAKYARSRAAASSGG